MAGYMSDLNGTVYDAETPSFLRFEIEEEAIMEDGVQAGAVDAHHDLEEFEKAVDLNVEEPASLEDGPVLNLDDFAVDDIESDKEPDTGDVIMSLEDLDDDSEEEVVPDAHTDDDASGPAIDFGDLDISDLKPPGEGRQDRDEPEQEGISESAHKIKEPDGEQKGLPEGGEEGGLADLLLGELNLDRVAIPDLPRKNKQPSGPVKTGTALDNFEVDLGELFAEEK